MAITRRTILKTGLFSALIVGGVTLIARTGLSPELAPGMRSLRAQDMAFLRKVTPVILQGALPPDNLPNAVFSTLKAVDYALTHLSTPQLKMARELLDVSASHATRGPLMGVWGDWENASDEAVQAFLVRWRDSALTLFQQGHAALLQLIQMAWYSQPEAWTHCGYPGPPRLG